MVHFACNAYMFALSYDAMLFETKMGGLAQCDGGNNNAVLSAGLILFLFVFVRCWSAPAK